MVLTIPDKKAVEEAVAVSDTNFIIHEVKKGETLYYLAVHYGVTIEEIKSANDFDAEGDLKLGSEIRIPKQKGKTSSGTTLPDNYHYHEIKPGETAYSLSKKYRISLDSIYLLNPSARDGLQISQLLRFPKNRALPKVSRPKGVLVSNDKKKEDVVGPMPEREDTLSDDFFLYKIEPGDSFFSLRQRFKVNKEELIAPESGIEGWVAVG